MRHFYFLLILVCSSEIIALPNDGSVDISSILSHVTQLESGLHSTMNALQKTMDDLESTKIELQTTKAQLNATASELQATKTGIQDDKRHSSAEITSLRNELVLKTKDVSFLVYWSGGSTGRNMPLKFERVHFNAGNGYNINTGKFTAPVTGTYIFSAQVQMYQSKTSIDVYIVQSGSTVSESHGETTDDIDQITIPITAITHVRQGEEVWVTSSSDVHVYQSPGKYYTCFVGTLLSAD